MKKIYKIALAFFLLSPIIVLINTFFIKSVFFAILGFVCMFIGWGCTLLHNNLK